MADHFIVETPRPVAVSTAKAMTKIKWKVYSCEGIKLLRQLC